MPPKKGKPSAFKKKGNKNPGMTKLKTIWIGEPTPPFTDDFEIGKQLGQPGQFGVACRVRRKSDGTFWAAKIVSKARFYHINRNARTKLLWNMRSEIDILSTLSHPYVIDLESVYEDKQNLYLVMLECKGGELFDRIVARGHYSEKEAARVLKQILEALDYMHTEHSVVHSDLKPDNILFLSEDDDSQIKIIDFGMSKVLPRLQTLRELVGTPYYTAPEILRGNYNHGADMWSVGVIMYVMLFGYPPFYVDPQRYGKNEAKAIYAKIQRGFQPVVKPGYGPWFPKDIKVSREAYDLMTRLLEMDVAKRSTAKEALGHPWFQKASPEGLTKAVFSKLATFNNTCNFKLAVVQMFKHKLDKLQLVQLRQVFNEMDKDKDGALTYDEFEAGMTRTTDLSKDQIQEVFANCDLDGDNCIRFDELVTAATHDYLLAVDERLYEAFRELDDDEDGFITVEELKEQMRKQSIEEWEKAADILAAGDLDEDGKIDYEEFLRSLHPNFNEPVVPHLPAAPGKDDDSKVAG